MRLLHYTLYVLIIFGVIVAMHHFKPRLILRPHGILLPLVPPPHEEAQHTLVNDIFLYQRMPAQAQSLGIIHVQYHQPAENTEAPNIMADYAISLARQVNANGVAIQFIGHGEDPDHDVLSGYRMVATAINTESTP